MVILCIFFLSFLSFFFFFDFFDFVFVFVFRLALEDEGACGGSPSGILTMVGDASVNSLFCCCVWAISFDGDENGDGTCDDNAIGD